MQFHMAFLDREKKPGEGRFSPPGIRMLPSGASHCPPPLVSFDTKFSSASSLSIINTLKTKQK